MFSMISNIWNGFWSPLGILWDGVKNAVSFGLGGGIIGAISYISIPYLQDQGWNEIANFFIRIGGGNPDAGAAPEFGEYVGRFAKWGGIGGAAYGVGTSAYDRVQANIDEDNANVDARTKELTDGGMDAKSAKRKAEIEAAGSDGAGMFGVALGVAALAAVGYLAHEELGGKELIEELRAGPGSIPNMAASAGSQTKKG